MKKLCIFKVWRLQNQHLSSIKNFNFITCVVLNAKRSRKIRIWGHHMMTNVPKNLYLLGIDFKCLDILKLIPLLLANQIKNTFFIVSSYIEHNIFRLSWPRLLRIHTVGSSRKYLEGFSENLKLLGWLASPYGIHTQPL